jgi:hypothetical protein
MRTDQIYMPAGVFIQMALAGLLFQQRYWRPAGTTSDYVKIEIRVSIGIIYVSLKIS